MRVQPILYTALALLVLLPAANAQPVLTPTPVSTGATTNAEWGAYTVTNSVEVGYRFTSVAGDANLFRSVENYDNGLRLFGGSFTANSKDGRGRLFDTIAINTSGLFNDPYGMANVRIEKNHLYRYDSTWRRHEYFNSARLNGAGGTQKETTRIIQDHELGITARKWATLVLGYSRNRESGPEYTYYETYIGGLARSLLPIQRDTRRDFNDYRLGGDFKFAGFLLSLSHRWQYYKDDSSIVPLTPGQPYALDYLRNLPFDPSFELTYPQAASSYSRSQPMHARTGAWFGALNRTERYWALTARMSYSKADSDSVYFERESGLSQAASNSVPTGDGRFLTGANSGYGPFANAFTYMPGNARHPFMAGDLSLTFYPTTKLTIVNSMSVQSNRYDGTGNELRVLDTGAAAVNRFWSFHIGTGRVSDAVDVNYKVNKWLGLNAEYRYTSRFIDNNLVRTGTTNGRDVNSARNHLNTGTLGFRLRPIRPLSLSVDGTVGRDNGPENPTSPAH